MRGEVHKIAVFVDFEAIVRPKGVVECEVSVFAIVGVVRVKEASHVACHVYAEFAVEVDFSLIEGAHSHSYLHTHQTITWA